jgi:hypothetical protein
MAAVCLPPLPLGSTFLVRSTASLGCEDGLLDCCRPTATPVGLTATNACVAPPDATMPKPTAGTKMWIRIIELRLLALSGYATNLYPLLTERSPKVTSGSIPRSRLQCSFRFVGTVNFSFLNAGLVERHRCGFSRDGLRASYARQNSAGVWLVGTGVP